MSEEYRVGSGFDAHAFEDGVPLVLGGVRVESEQGLAGHSLGDIGSLFPSDPGRTPPGISSIVLLEQAYARVREAGWELSNADCVFIGQEPRLTPIRDEMRSVLAQAIGVEEDRIAVRATTTDFLGFTGRGEGLAAQAVALLRRRP